MKDQTRTEHAQPCCSRDGYAGQLIGPVLSLAFGPRDDGLGLADVEFSAESSWLSQRSCISPGRCLDRDDPALYDKYLKTQTNQVRSGTSTVVMRVKLTVHLVPRWRDHNLLRPIFWDWLLPQSVMFMSGGVSYNPHFQLLIFDIHYALMTWQRSLL